MSSQKEVVIGKIRQHLQSKFKRYPNAQHHIEQGLQEISKKPTISKNVFNVAVLHLNYLGSRPT